MTPFAPQLTARILAAAARVAALAAARRTQAAAACCALCPARCRGAL